MVVLETHAYGEELSSRIFSGESVHIIENQFSSDRKEYDVLCPRYGQRVAV